MRKKKGWWKKNWQVLIVSLVVFSLWLLTPLIINQFVKPTDEPSAIAQRGQFGDMYGFVTSLFSGITIIGLLYTIVLQRREIKQTKKELKKQNAANNSQRFDKTFFQLNKIYTDIFNNLVVADNVSREAFIRILTSFEYGIHAHISSSYKDNKIKFSNLDKDWKFAFVNYIKTITTILEYIYTSNLITEKEKQSYANILFSQLSIPEKKFIFYYAVFDMADNRFSALLSKYGFFKSLGELKLVNNHDNYLVYLIPEEKLD